MSRDLVIMPMKPEKEGMGHFLPSRYRTFWPLRVSRYRVVKELVNYPGAAKFIGAVARSAFVKWYYPILVAALKAKNVTNNLPLLSVLAFRANSKIVTGNQIVIQMISGVQYNFDESLVTVYGFYVLLWRYLSLSPVTGLDIRLRVTQKA